MINLIYFSHADRAMSSDDLQELLNRARDRNKTKGITGLLLYQSGYFLQALEGDRESVRALFEKIQADPRHHTMTKIYDQETEERNFKDWQMGFHLVTGKELEGYDGYSEILSTEVATNEIDLANEMTFVTVSLFKQYVRAAEAERAAQS